MILKVALAVCILVLYLAHTKGADTDLRHVILDYLRAMLRTLAEEKGDTPHGNQR